MCEFLCPGVSVTQRLMLWAWYVCVSGFHCVSSSLLSRPCAGSVPPPGGALAWLPLPPSPGLLPQPASPERGLRLGNSGLTRSPPSLVAPPPALPKAGYKLPLLSASALPAARGLHWEGPAAREEFEESPPAPDHGRG